MVPSPFLVSPVLCFPRFSNLAESKGRAKSFEHHNQSQPIIHNSNPDHRSLQRASETNTVMPDRTTDNAGFFVVTVLIVLGWPLALVLLRNVLLYLGSLEWLKTLGEEVRGACGRRADLLSRRLEEEMGQRLSSKVLSAARQSKEFVSEKSTKLISVVKNELLSSCDIETFSITHVTHDDSCDPYPDPYSSDTRYAVG
jgi:hypothetical protein